MHLSLVSLPLCMIKNSLWVSLRCLWPFWALSSWINKCLCSNGLIMSGSNDCHCSIKTLTYKLFCFPILLRFKPRSRSTSRPSAQHFPNMSQKANYRCPNEEALAVLLMTAALSVASLFFVVRKSTNRCFGSTNR